jgi:membrane protein YqaA with SNARE-associated domain
VDGERRRLFGGVAAIPNRNMNILLPYIRFIFQLGYFGPLVMGILDSSFLVLPFGNDLVVVGMVAHHRDAAPWYVLMAAAGSTIGVLILSLVARKLGEEGITKVAGEQKYRKIRDRIGNRAAAAVGLAGLLPPPFPFTVVIAAVAAVDYPIWRILVVNFCSRAVRFAVLAVLAIEFGSTVLHIAHTPAFEWSMIVFIALCVIASAISVWQWWSKTHRGENKGNNDRKPQSSAA